MEWGSMKGEQKATIDLLQPPQRVCRSSPFSVKLYQIVDDPNTNHIVSWGPSGDSLIVLQPPLLEETVLPMYFNHNNFNSFTRQLNTYGFRKIDQQKWEFAREGFKAGQQRHLLETIKRQNNRTLAPKVDNDVLEVLLDDLSLLRADFANQQKLSQDMWRRMQKMESLAKASLNPTVEGSIHRRKEIKEIDTIQKRMLNAISSGGNTKGEAYAAVPFGTIMSDADVGKNWGQLTCEENASPSPIIVQSPIRERKAMKEIDIRKRRRLTASSSGGVNVTQQEELGAIRSNIARALDKDSTREFKDWKGGPILSTSSKNVSNADRGKKLGQLVREKGAHKMVREKGAHSNSIVVGKGTAVMEDTDRSIASSSGTKFEEVRAAVGVIASQQELGPNESNIAPPNDSTSEFLDNNCWDLKEGPIPSTSGTNCWDDPLFTITEDEASAWVGETEDDVAIEDFLDNNLDWSEVLQSLNQVDFQESSP